MVPPENTIRQRRIFGSSNHKSSFNMKKTITFLLVLLKGTMIAISFSPLPLEEAAYHSANSLADLIGCNEMHVPPASLTTYLEQQRNTDDLNELFKFELNFNSIALSYGDSIYNIASTMLTCLSPHEQSSNETTCPFDPHVMYMIPPDVVFETRKELRRIQHVSTLMHLFVSEEEHTFQRAGWSGIFAFWTIPMYTSYIRLSILDHHSLPSLESVWHLVCHTPLEIPVTIHEVLPVGDEFVVEISTGAFLDAFFESEYCVPVIILIFMVTLFFTLEIILDPIKCRYVTMKLKECKYYDVIRRLRF